MKHKRKAKISHAQKTIAAYNKFFLEKLEKGIPPRYAAKLAKIARSTIYNWKRDDAEFAAAWDDAIQTSVICIH